MIIMFLYVVVIFKLIWNFDKRKWIHSIFLSYFISDETSTASNISGYKVFLGLFLWLFPLNSIKI